ncbi:MAG: ArsR/SmtB family transcription factor [Candidatus Zixiibacteriota bacterium]
MCERCCQVFQAMADKTRLKILELLAKQECCVSEVCQQFSMTQPSISHHLDMLKRAGLVGSDKRGREVYYSFRRDVIVECCGKQFNLFDLVVSRK